MSIAAGYPSVPGAVRCMVISLLQSTYIRAPRGRRGSPITSPPTQRLPVHSTSLSPLHDMSPDPKTTEQVAKTRAHIPPVTDFGITLDPDVENLLWDSTALARAYGGACK
jgi:hypothetical protein